MKIYLIGYSYSGKTTLGKQLAKELNYVFFDTDKAIEIKYRTSVPLLFKRYGEKAFRTIEDMMLRTTADMDNTVISTGGGSACNEANISFILEHGTTIFLQMSVDDIMHRIAHARKGRPSLEGMTTEEQRIFITHQLEQRLPFYSRAHITVPAINANVHQVLEILKTL